MFILKYYSLPNILSIWSVSIYYQQWINYNVHQKLGKQQHFSQVVAGPKFQVLNVLQRVTACEIAHRVAESSADQ